MYRSVLLVHGKSSFCSGQFLYIFKQQGAIWCSWVYSAQLYSFFCDVLSITVGKILNGSRARMNHRSLKTFVSILKLPDNWLWMAVSAQKEQLDLEDKGASGQKMKMISRVAVFFFLGKLVQHLLAKFFFFPIIFSDTDLVLRFIKPPPLTVSR